MRITSVERSKKGRERMSIYIDGKFAFTISENDYISMNLYENTELSEEKIDYIRNNLNFRNAKAAAVRYLSTKIRTEYEVLEKLLKEGFDRECAEKAVGELKSIGYINDKLYAQKYIFDRSKLKPLSKKLMKQELLTRGVAEEIADEVLKDWKADDATVATGLLKRKFGKYDMADVKIKKKAYTFLSHRGFSHEIIKEAYKNVAGNDFEQMDSR